MTARGHFTSNPAYPRQGSSSIFNCLPNWLDFMDRRVGVYFGYFSRLEEAGTSTISIIDTGEKTRSAVPGTSPPPRDHASLLFLVSVPLRSYRPAPPPRARFPDFLQLFPERRVIIPGRNFPASRPCVLSADHLSSDRITISCIERQRTQPASPERSDIKQRRLVRRRRRAEWQLCKVIGIYIYLFRDTPLTFLAVTCLTYRHRFTQ